MTARAAADQSHVVACMLGYGLRLRRRMVAFAIATPVRHDDFSLFPHCWHWMKPVPDTRCYWQSGDRAPSRYLCSMRPTPWLRGRAPSHRLAVTAQAHAGDVNHTRGLQRPSRRRGGCSPMVGRGLLSYRALCSARSRRPRGTARQRRNILSFTGSIRCYRT